MRQVVKAHHKEYARFTKNVMEEARGLVRRSLSPDGTPNMLRALQLLVEETPPEHGSGVVPDSYHDRIARHLIGAGHVASQMTLVQMRDRQVPRWWGWQAFAESRVMASYLDYGDRAGIPMGSILSNLRSRWAAALFDLTGRRAYEVSDALSERLLLTDLADRDTGEPVLTEHLRLPYEPLIYIEVPPVTNFRIPAFSERRKQHELYPVTGIYVVEDYIGKVQRRGYEGRTWTMLLWGPSTNDDPTDDALFFFNVHLPEGKSLAEALDQTDADIDSKQWHDDMDRWSDPETKAFARANWRSIFEWVMNVVMYATWPRADSREEVRNPAVQSIYEKWKAARQGSARRKEFRARLDRMDPDRVILLGGGLAPMRRHGPPQGAGALLDFRQVVQGHWKRVAHGTGRLERRWTFIEPYERGPEGAPLGPSKHRLVLASDMARK